jgi:hypothetical protein
MPKQIVYGITRQELIKHTNVCLTPSYLVELNKPRTRHIYPGEITCWTMVSAVGFV